MIQKKLKEYLIVKIFYGFNGILVPGGFGKDGTIKINAIKISKKLKIPFLGICFGMQLAIFESISNLKGFEKLLQQNLEKLQLQ